MIYRTSSAHEEGGERTYAVTTLEFLGDAAVAGCGRCGWRTRPEFSPVPGTERELPCDLVAAGHGIHRGRTSPVAR